MGCTVSRQTKARTEALEEAVRRLSQKVDDVISITAPMNSLHIQGDEPPHAGGIVPISQSIRSLSPMSSPSDLPGATLSASSLGSLSPLPKVKRLTSSEVMMTRPARSTSLAKHPSLSSVSWTQNRMTISSDMETNHREHTAIDEENQTKTFQRAVRLVQLQNMAKEQRQSTEASLATSDAGHIPEHIMLSYNWEQQKMIRRINAALKARAYTVWIDIERMLGGSTVLERMAEAIEHAVVVCYGISKAYSRSFNCRTEAQYAFQQKKVMTPLMLEKGYSPTGWLGILLGARVWHGFYGSVLAISDSAFEGKMDELCQELGDRGRC